MLLFFDGAVFNPWPLFPCCCLFDSKSSVFFLTLFEICFCAKISFFFPVVKRKTILFNPFTQGYIYIYNRLFIPYILLSHIPEVLFFFSLCVFVLFCSFLAQAAQDTNPTFYFKPVTCRLVMLTVERLYIS